jgi:hypothetical protein
MMCRAHIAELKDTGIQQGELEMKKMIVGCIATMAWASISMAVVTNTLQVGGTGQNRGWNSNVANTNVSPTEYTVVLTPPPRYVELSNLTFSVTVSETNGIPIYINGAGAWCGATNGHASRLDTNEVLKLTVSYSDPDNVLTDFRLKTVGTYYNTSAWETMVFSDGVTDKLVNIAEYPKEGFDQFVDYEATGLTPLTTNNVDTWAMWVSVDDTLGGGTNFTEAGLGAFELEYIADVEEVEGYILLEPANFAFVDGSEFDAKILGDNATMTRSNSWGTAITIATVDIIGQDGSKASEGAAHKTNIYKTWGNNLGINDATVTGTEYGNFNLGEAWVVTFDTDVYLTEIDMTSQTGDDEMTIKSSAFPDIVLADGESNDIHDLGNAFVPAGTNVTFECTGPADPAGGLRIAYLSVQVPSDANSYDAWIQSEGLISQLNDGYEDDPDVDTMDNLMEYALGGEALVDDAGTYLPVYGPSADGGTNYLDYVYRRRLDRDMQGLSYMVSSSADLVSDAITNATEEAGSVALDATYESVTNRVSTDAADAQFMQLNVTAD